MTFKEKTTYFVTCDFIGCGSRLDNAPNSVHDLENLLRREGWTDRGDYHYCPLHPTCDDCIGTGQVKCGEYGQGKTCPNCKGLGLVDERPKAEGEKAWQEKRNPVEDVKSMIHKCLADTPGDADPKE